MTKIAVIMSYARLAKQFGATQTHAKCFIQTIITCHKLTVVAFIARQLPMKQKANITHLKLLRHIKTSSTQLLCYSKGLYLGV